VLVLHTIASATTASERKREKRQVACYVFTAIPTPTFDLQEDVTFPVRLEQVYELGLLVEPQGLGCQPGALNGPLQLREGRGEEGGLV
jgi:hypothetical protein